MVWCVVVWYGVVCCGVVCGGVCDGYGCCLLDGDDERRGKERFLGKLRLDGDGLLVSEHVLKATGVCTTE